MYYKSKVRMVPKLFMRRMNILYIHVYMHACFFKNIVLFLIKLMSADKNGENNQYI